jgi:hypothetical protein
MIFASNAFDCRLTELHPPPSIDLLVALYELSAMAEVAVLLLDHYFISSENDRIS